MVGTLYVTDLDGTVVNSSGQFSNYSKQIIRRLIEKDVNIAFATGRSWSSSRKMIEGMFSRFSILSNGAVTVSKTCELTANYVMEPEIVSSVLLECRRHKTSPLIHTVSSSVECSYWLPAAASAELISYWNHRQEDSRSITCASWDSFPCENVFRVDITADNFMRESLKKWMMSQRKFIDSIFLEENPFDLKSDYMQLQIKSIGCSKGNAIKAISSQLGIDRIVAFGNDVNDVSMFEVADESYLVGNKFTEKSQGDLIRLGEDVDSCVARWLENNLLIPVERTYLR